MDFGIIDAHCHIFPPLAGACGFPDAATHLLHQQRSMHVHGNQPYRRASDHALVSERPLVGSRRSLRGGPQDRRRLSGRPLRPLRMDGRRRGSVRPVPAAAHDRPLRAGRRWSSREMDYAGDRRRRSFRTTTSTAISPEDFAAAAAAYPGRFRRAGAGRGGLRLYATANSNALPTRSTGSAWSALYFTTTGLFRGGYARLPDHPDYEPLWREVERRGLTDRLGALGEVAGRHL